EMLRYFIGRVGGGRLSFSRVVLCVPSGITKVERAAVEEATIAGGARSVVLIEEPLAAAIGAGLPIAEPRGSMIVDIGGGTADIGTAGIVLAGGGALLRGLDQRVAEATGLPVRIADSPLEAVVTGAGATLEESELLRASALQSTPRRRRRRRAR